MKTVAIIPARGGSRRIPRKNIKLFHGKPIIAYSIETASQSALFDKIYVSTDDVEIATVARQYGAKIITRAPELAKDEVGTQEVMLDVLQDIDCDYACCIYPTAPLMTIMDLIMGYCDFRVYNFNYILVEGWFYWGRSKDFGNIPIDISTALSNRLEAGDRYIDINTESDWLRAEEMYSDFTRR